jgi:hypothetical protein
MMHTKDCYEQASLTFKIIGAKCYLTETLMLTDIYEVRISNPMVLLTNDKGQDSGAMPAAA